MESSGVSWCRGKGRWECRQQCARTKGRSQPGARRFSYRYISCSDVKNKIHSAIEFSLPKKWINFITFLWPKDRSWLSKFQLPTNTWICKFIIQKKPQKTKTNPKHKLNKQTKIISFLLGIRSDIALTDIQYQGTTVAQSGPQPNSHALYSLCSVKDIC